MQKSTFLLILLVSTLFVGDTDAWRRRRRSWFRRTVRNVGTFFKETGPKVRGAVEKVGDFVNKHGPTIITGIAVGKAVASAVGKRSADMSTSTCPEIEQAKVQMEQLLDRLETDCPTFGVDTSQGVTPEVVMSAFTKSDADGDDELNDSEMATFEKILDVYAKCEEIMLETQ